MVWDYNVRAFDVAKFLENLYLDFSLLNQSNDVDDMCSRFYEIIAMDTIPPASFIISNNDEAWIIPVVKLLIDKRWATFIFVSYADAVLNFSIFSFSQTCQFSRLMKIVLHF